MQSQDLLEAVERRRRKTLQDINLATQASLGQYFTPSAAAALIASMPDLATSGTLKILDPGAGTGSLAAALVARVLEESPGTDIHLVAIEIDELVTGQLRRTMADLQTAVADTSSKLIAEVIVDDFIDPSAQFDEDFDLIIMNPPYFKLPAASRHRKAMLRLGVHAPNIYAAFLARAALMLKQGGQMVAITPRSFTNGVYFESFRQFFLDRMTLDHIHVFDSRSTVFSDTGVLQENIIINAVRGGTVEHVDLTASIGHQDEVRLKTVRFENIVQPNDPRKFIRIPVGQEDDAIVAMMLDLPTTLEDLGVTVSTGRVVDFRSRGNLLARATSGFPMVYPANIKYGLVEHPKENAKPQWFNVVEESDQKWLVPNGTYVLIKRFSSKEEHRRIVAGIWSTQINLSGQVAFDNKLNYMHCDGAGLDAVLATGLSIWLNSGPVDKYFRTFSGHTQVNATDLREMRYPTMAELQILGGQQNAELPSQEAIDRSVMNILGRKEAAV